MGLGYTVGRALGRHKGVAAAVALSGLVTIGFVVNRTSAIEREAATAVAKAEQENAAKRKEAAASALAARTEKCTTGAAPLMADARKFLATGAPDQASAVLAPCRMVGAFPEVQALISKAAAAESAQTVKVAAAQAAKEKARRKKEGVSVGMSKQDVLESSWGRPSKVNTTTSKYGTREQWVYDPGGYLYFEDGTLTTIQN